VRVMDTVKGVHPNPVSVSKSAPRRTVKLNMAWEGKGLGRVRAMACGVKANSIHSQPPCEWRFSAKFASHFRNHTHNTSFAVGFESGADFPAHVRFPEKMASTGAKILKPNVVDACFVSDPQAVTGLGTEFRTLYADPHQEGKKPGFPLAKQAQTSLR
jgi:hypothetical protein